MKASIPLMTDILPCVKNGEAESQVTPDSQIAMDIQSARRLLDGRHRKQEDVGFDSQQAAQQLWQERIAVCGAGAPADPAVERVLTGIASE